MNKDNIIKIIADWFHKNYISGNPKTPPHQHNGVDNLPIQSTDIVGGLVTQIVAGTDITITPSTGTGAVTINATSSGGTPGGSDRDVQFNNSGSFGGDTAFTFKKVLVGFTVYDILNVGEAQLYSDNSASGAITSPGVLVVQSGFDRVTGTTTANKNINIKASNFGAIVISGFTGQVDIQQNLGVAATSGTADYGGGLGVLALQDAATVPTTTPTGGGVLYSSAGALHWLGSSGTDTVIAPA